MTGANVHAGKLQCGACSAPLPRETAVLGVGNCGACGASQLVQVFPAALRPRVLESAQAPPAVEGESACYYHPTKKAEAVCAVSGAFLCRLCAIEAGGQALSPRAFEEAVRAQELPPFVLERTRHAERALNVSFLGLLFFGVPFFGMLVGGAGIALAAWGWRKGGGLLTRERGKAAMAIFLGLLAIAFNVLVMVAIVSELLGGMD